MTDIVSWQGDPPLPVLRRVGDRVYEAAGYTVQGSANGTWLVHGPGLWTHARTLRRARTFIAGKLEPRCVNGCDAPFGIRCSVCNTDQKRAL